MAKKKRLTLNETWVLCLQMRKWVATQRKKGSRVTISNLILRWLEKHRYQDGELDSDCFFCEYDRQHRRQRGPCSFCPGVLVEPGFSCTDDDCDYEERPIAFYAKLVELNKKRKRRK